MFTQGLNVNVYNSFIHNHQKWKQSKRPPTGKWMNCAQSAQQNTIQQWEGANQVYSQKDRKSYMLCDSTNMHSGTGNAIGGNQPVAIQGWGRGKGMNDKKVQGNFGGW